MAIDPIFTYVGGIAFLVLIIGSMLYLTFSTMDIDEGDEHPGESVVKGVGQDEPTKEDEFESAAPVSEGGSAESEETDEEADTDEEGAAENESTDGDAEPETESDDESADEEETDAETEADDDEESA